MSIVVIRATEIAIVFRSPFGIIRGG